MKKTVAEAFIEKHVAQGENFGMDAFYILENMRANLTALTKDVETIDRQAERTENPQLQRAIRELNHKLDIAADMAEKIAIGLLRTT